MYKCKAFFLALLCEASLHPAVVISEVDLTADCSCSAATGSELQLQFGQQTNGVDMATSKTNKQIKKNKKNN